ncbi:MAG: YggS family pyridoxal phosphate-dependent enzyme [Actinobacteria bacterium]|nr:YggS family pyridoxal phosphate-dependent enzyme [Actinomycetota bacterium]
MTLHENLERVRKSIGAAARRTGRSPDDVTLVAVTKTWPADVVLEAIGAGATDFGENRAQEFREKVTILGDRARWHFIGHLQTNKVRSVVGSCELIHSVDRLGLAESIARRAAIAGSDQDVLVEVNVAGDPNKHGVEPTRAVALALEIEELEGVRVRGLMTMPPYPQDPEQSRPHYRELAALSAQLTAELPGADSLSMGMSRDFEVAIEEGATIVRVGTAIFGSRTGR